MTQKEMIKRAFKEATPVARKVAVQRLREGKSFDEIEDWGYEDISTGVAIGDEAW